MQDVEFTVERGKLWLLQTRDAKRTAQAAVRIAVDFANERRITRAEAVQRVTPEQVDYFLHPQFPPAVRKAAQASGALIATGLNVSPGAASGVLAFDADTAERWSRDEKKAVIMVRPETKPDDVHGMLAARGILTSHGGRTSHAALVARQFGKPAVVGVTTLEVDPAARQLTVGGRVLREGDAVSIDGTTGEVFVGSLETVVPEFDDPALLTLLAWADGFRRLGVWANADYPVDAERARALRRGGHRPDAYRAHVLPDRAAADRAADDPGAGRRRARRVPGAAAADAAGGFHRAVPRHGRCAGDHPADRSAAARIPAQP